MARVTAEPQKAMGQDAALQVVVKFALYIGRQTFGIRIGVEQGEKGLEMVRDHFIEHRIARIAWFIGGNSRSHGALYVQHRGYGCDRERHWTILHVCTLYKKKYAVRIRNAKKVRHLLALQSARAAACMAHPLPPFSS